MDPNIRSSISDVFSISCTDKSVDCFTRNLDRLIGRGEVTVSIETPLLQDCGTIVECVWRLVLIANFGGDDFGGDDFGGHILGFESLVLRNGVIPRGCSRLKLREPKAKL